jgi:hypothetical protein
MSQDDGIKGGASAEYVFYCDVPDDLKGQNLIVNVFVYGEFVGNNHPSLSTTQDSVYGTIPNDYDKVWSVAKTEQQTYPTYPSLVPYLWQGGSIATNILFIISLAVVVHITGKIKNTRVKQYGFYFAVMILMLVIFAIAFLLTSSLS